MNRNLFIVSILWLFIATTGWSQKLELAPTPLAGGFSAERLKVLDTRLNEWVEKGWMQGGTALIARNGKIVYYKAVGYNDMEAKVVMKKK